MDICNIANELRKKLYKVLAKFYFNKSNRNLARSGDFTIW